MHVERRLDSTRLDSTRLDLDLDLDLEWLREWLELRVVCSRAANGRPSHHVLQLTPWPRPLALTDWL